MPKKILIIGKNSFIAKYFISKSSFKITAIGRDAKLYKINLNKFDYIINFAANIFDEKKMFDDNVFLINQIYSHYIKCFSRAKIILFGSASEYGKCNFAPNEIYPAKPENIYGGTKAAGNMIASGFANQFNIPTLVLRTYTIYGPYEDNSKLIPNIFRHLKLRRKLNIYQGVQDYTFVEDLNCMLKKIILRWKFKDKFTILNVGSGRQYSNFQVLKLCEKVSGIKAKAKIIKKFKKKFHSNIWISSINKRCELNYLFKNNLSEGLKIYWDEFVKNNKLRKSITKNIQRKFIKFK
jgi:nucleoside-diphosphate-sugar epimerase